jgi:hypothetical protein
LLKAKLKIGLLLTGLFSPVFFKSKPLQIERVLLESLFLIFSFAKLLQCLLEIDMFSRILIDTMFENAIVLIRLKIQSTESLLSLLLISEWPLHSYSHPRNISMQNSVFFECCFFLFFHCFNEDSIICSDEQK